MRISIDFLHKIQTCSVHGHYLNQYRPHLNFPHLHDHGGHQELHGGGVHQDSAFMCDTCFMPRFLPRIQKFDLLWPHLTLFHLHDTGGH